MKIEILVRWLDKKKPESDEIKAKRLVDPGFEPDEEEVMSYTYDPMVLETEDISGFNKLDETFTIVRTVNSEAFCVKMQYEQFKKAYIRLTGASIETIRDYDEVEAIDIS